MVTRPQRSSETIAAVATPAGRGGIGVVRISGPALGDLALAVTGKRLLPRHASLTDFIAADGAVIDRGIAILFPAPHSFTGEDVLELQGHGGPVVIGLLLQRCLELGARTARPGEFSERAFLNGCIDLVQAEAVADLIDAATASAARGAVRSLQGDFSRAIDGLAGELIALRSLTEATLDFPEEELDFLRAADAERRLGDVLRQLDAVLATATRGNLLRAGIHVVLAGRPNVGKSSLLNRLAGDELAIVTAVPGTTRDALRGSIQVRGVPLHVIDTAGLRDTDDEVEQIGIARSWREIERADVVLLVVDSRDGVTAADRRIIAQLPPRLPRLTLYNKCDLGPQPARRQDDADQIAIHLSAITGEGIDLLEQALLDVAGWNDGEGTYTARERHLEALRLARTHVLQAAAEFARLECFAEELRLAHRALMQITGAYSSDDLLGEVFASFCIGK